MATARRAVLLLISSLLLSSICAVSPSSSPLASPLAASPSALADTDDGVTLEALSASGAVPAARADGSFVASDAFGVALVLGGSLGAYDAALNLTSLTWSTLPSSLGLSGHCTAVDSATHAAQLFGGLPASNNSGMLLRFDVGAYPSSLVRASSPSSPALEAQRYGAACAIADDHAIVARGGQADASPDAECADVTVRGVWSADGMSVTWTALNDSATAPPPKRGAVLVALSGSDALALVGGVLCGNSSDRAVSPVWRLHMSRAEWQPDAFDASGEWAYLAGLHSAAVARLGDALFVYGGVVAGNAQSALLRYDLSAHKWSLLSPSLGAAVGASLALSSPSRALLSGGSLALTSGVAQLVDAAYCASSVGCAACIATPGCVFAYSTVSQCVAGSSGAPFVLPASNASVEYVSSLARCPAPPGAPRWLIPVVAVVLALIALVVAGSIYLDTRKSKQRAGYQSV